MASSRRRGAAGLAHGNRGRPCVRRVPKRTRDKLLALARGEFRDFNDQHFTEILAEEYAIRLSRSTVRRLQEGGGSRRPARAGGVPADTTRSGNATRRQGCSSRSTAAITTGWKGADPNWFCWRPSMTRRPSSSMPVFGSKRMRRGTSGSSTRSAGPTVCPWLCTRIATRSSESPKEPSVATGWKGSSEPIWPPGGRSGHWPHSGAFSASQGARGAPFRHVAGPIGQSPAASQGQHAGRGQSALGDFPARLQRSLWTASGLPGVGLPALVSSHSVRGSLFASSLSARWPRTTLCLSQAIPW